MEKGGKGMRKLAAMAMTLLLMLVLVACSDSTPKGDSSSQADVSAPFDTGATSVNVSSTDKSSGKNRTTQAGSIYEAELSSGNYTAGIDFPAGTYDIQAISGIGHVASSNLLSGGLNETMAINDSRLLKSYEGAELPKGTLLTVGGMKVKISSSNAEQGKLEKRENPDAEEIELSGGSYVAGTDFKAGVYDIIYVSRIGGRVSSTNAYDGGIDEIIGPTSYPEGRAEQEYKNVYLPQGTTLRISDVTIRLVPSR
jgi:hypothetical protein